MSQRSTRNAAHRVAATFVIPASMEDAERRREELVAKKQEVEFQLGDKNRTNQEGRRMVGDEYWEWRRRAVAALTFMNAELRHLNLWIKQTRRANTADKAMALDVNPNDPMSLLLGVCNVVQRLRSDGVDLDPDEQSVVDAAKSFLVSGRK